MKKRKHGLCQKPMTRTVGEARRMAQSAREMKVATSCPSTIRFPDSRGVVREWIAAGTIGTCGGARLVEPAQLPARCRTAASASPGSRGPRLGSLGGARPLRPYNRRLSSVPVARLVRLRHRLVGQHGVVQLRRDVQNSRSYTAVGVEACATGFFDSSVAAREESYPKASAVHEYFPARGGDRPAVRVTWCEAAAAAAPGWFDPAGRPLLPTGWSQ